MGTGSILGSVDDGVIGSIAQIIHERASYLVRTACDSSEYYVISAVFRLVCPNVLPYLCWTRGPISKAYAMPASDLRYLVRSEKLNRESSLSPSFSLFRILRNRNDSALVLKCAPICAPDPVARAVSIVPKNIRSSYQAAHSEQL